MDGRLCEGPAVVVWPSSGIHVGRDGRTRHVGIRGTGISHVIRRSAHLYHEAYPSELAAGQIALVPLISFHDVLNMVRFRADLERAHLIVGGPACVNIRPLTGFVSAAAFGRCDGGQIDRIIAGEALPSVWRAPEPLRAARYVVGEATELAPSETAVGCRRKCAFCFYSWWNRYTTRQSGLRYESGFHIYEDCWDTLDWRKAVRGAVTALDGFHADTRAAVNKPISSDAIVVKLLEADAVDTQTTLRLKLYLIAGYPWERNADLDANDLVDSFARADKRLRRARIVVRLHISHFIPFPKTPMGHVAFNAAVNARQWAIERPLLYAGDHITVHTGGLYAPHPATAATSTVVMRASADDWSLLETMASPRWLRQSGDERLRWLLTHAAHLLCETPGDPLDYVTTPNERLLRRTRIATAA